MCINPKHLRLGSAQDNADDAYRNKKIPRGEQRPNAKLVSSTIIEIIRLSNDGIQQKKISEMFGVSRACVSNVIRGKSWLHITRPEDALEIMPRSKTENMLARG
jgi:predicted XRE-type DNA-binding protein